MTADANPSLACRLPASVDDALVVGALVAGRPCGLGDHVPAHYPATPLTVAEPAGRDIFRRTAGLAAVEAARRESIPLRELGASITTGVPIHFEGDDSSAWLAPLERALSALIAEDVALVPRVLPTDDAIALCEERGLLDAAMLLEGETREHVTLITCGESVALATGPVLPSTAFVRGASIAPHPHGALLDFGDAIRRQLPKRKTSTLLLENQAPRYGAEMTQSEHTWLRRLGITSVGAFNRACVSGRTRSIIQVSEGYHEKRIAEIADAICARRNVRIVAVAGPSSSGKTTFIKRLKIQLEIDGIHTRSLSLDDYFVDRERTPRDDAGDYDFETLDALDLERLDAHLSALVEGKRQATARFDFRAGKSHPEGGPVLQLGDEDVLLIEGLHALNARILAPYEPSRAFRIFVHPATTLRFDHLSVMDPADVRLLRRIVRDRHHRGHSVADSLSRWQSVRKSERLHVFPHQLQADRVFDTSLIYEPSVLKVYGERYLREVPRSTAAVAAAHRLRRLLEPFVPIDPSEVPPTSILREFIGDSVFSYG